MDDEVRARIEELEAAVAIREVSHLELDEVVRTLFARVERLERELEQLRAQVRRDEESAFDLEGEKPPHYGS